MKTGSGTCEPVSSKWGIESFKVQGDKLILGLKITETINEGTLVLKFKESGFIYAALETGTVYPDDYLIVEDVTVVKSAVDTMLTAI